MKILIVSDTHGYLDNLKKAINSVGRIDKLIHLGDVERQENLIRDMVSASCAVCMVAGNNDYYSDLPKEKVISLPCHRVLLTHGNIYRIFMGYDFLIGAAKRNDCDIVMFGHTHKPLFTTECGVTLINPGSLTYPRQEGRAPTYMIMNVSPNGEMDVKVYKVPISR